MFNKYTARHLASYLRYLDQNKTAYQVLFNWRLKPPGLGLLRSVKPWCNLCQKLMTENKLNLENNRTMFRFSAITRQSYIDIYSW
jgi:hypothetical protein